MAVKIIGLILCMIAIDGIAGRTLPSFLKPCKRNDPAVNQCLKRMLENLRPYITKGIPEMNVLPLDPVAVPTVTLNQGTGPVNFAALFTDLKGYGGKNYEILSANANFKNRSLEIEVGLPLFRIESKYEVNGKVLVLPIKGSGKFVGNFTNAQAKIKLALNMIQKKDGKTYVEIKENKIHLIFGAVKLHFSNLFNGNKALGDQTNRFINENWKDLMQETRPLIEDTVSAIVVGILKPVLESFTIDDLFPV